MLPYIVYYLSLLGIVVIGLDHHFGWSDIIPALRSGFTSGLGVDLFLGGYLLSTRDLVENRFFSSVVRIQTDRGHMVCDSGPYRFMHRPDYLVGILIWLTTLLIHSSLLEFFPATALVILYIVCTRLEDPTLQAELPRFTEYDRKV